MEGDFQRLYIDIEETEDNRNGNVYNRRMHGVWTLSAGVP
jgi:hypothetical protein